MNQIDKYNNLIKKIVQKFATRYLTEINEEKTIADNSDYDIMEFYGILQGPVVICDMYLQIDDILIAQKFMIPAEIINDWYYENYENQDGYINLYCYFNKLGKNALNVNK